jgi:putative transposase
MVVKEDKHLRELDTENCRLKELVADLSLDNKILKEIVSKK